MDRNEFKKTVAKKYEQEKVRLDKEREDKLKALRDDLEKDLLDVENYGYMYDEVSDSYIPIPSVYIAEIIITAVRYEGSTVVRRFRVLSEEDITKLSNALEGGNKKEIFDVFCDLSERCPDFFNTLQETFDGMKKIRNLEGVSEDNIVFFAGKDSKSKFSMDSNFEEYYGNFNFEYSRYFVNVALFSMSSIEFDRLKKRTDSVANSGKYVCMEPTFRNLSRHYVEQ
ncbi:MAG: hypothetical protein MJ245_05900 [Clostridia bacterium]|nr:hypothetical protein [Clostridia bacterium]